MTEPKYTTIDDLDNETPRVPQAASFVTPPRDRGRPDSRASLTSSFRSPALGVFSSAQSYSPLSPDLSQGGGGDGILRSTPSRPFLPSSQSTYSSRPMSRSSSHMLGNDYDSVYQLAGYGDKEAIPMQGYGDKDDRSSMLSPPLNNAEAKDYRSAGIAKYGLAADHKRAMSPKKKWGIFGGVVALLIIIAVAVAVPLLTVHKNVNDNTASSGPGSKSGPTLATAGGNGSVIQMANGTSFTYINNFGGQWRSDLTDNSAQAQSYTPPLNQSWDYTKNRILGVNLGGWLVIEPFIVPSLFETYENDSTKYVVDEYTLIQQWEKEGGVDLATKNLQQHYDTFITEYDFAQIAAAGLNWVRLPIGYWAVATMPGEPFIEGLAWNYFIKAIQWARKYGLRIELDLHAVPGSQNGYNHGGRLGVFNFLNSPAGLVSAQRTLDIIRTLTEFISQPSVANVVPAFGVLNEPNIPVGIGKAAIQAFYVEAYNTVRNTTGLGQGKGPMMFLHDGFMGLPTYSGLLQDGDRVGWDLHPYICFVPPFGDRPALPVAACNGFQANTDQGFSQFGVTIAGEFSLATNDCGLFLNGPFQGVRYDGTFSSGQYSAQGSCVSFDDWQNYNATTKQQMHDGAVAQMAAFQNFFFWTWKIGDSLRTGGPVNPNWSYLLGLQEGWMPTNPNSHLDNGCAELQATYTSITKTALTWPGTFADYQTGGASTYAPYTANYSYPPASIASSGTNPTLTANLLPTYTPTGAHLTPFVMPTPTASVKNEPIPTYNAWAGNAYTEGSYAAIAGCNYFPDIWQNVTSIPSGWPCSGTAQKRDYSHVFKKRQPSPRPTPMPIMRR